MSRERVVSVWTLAATIGWVWSVALVLAGWVQGIPELGHLGVICSVAAGTITVRCLLRAHLMDTRAAFSTGVEAGVRRLRP